MVGHFVSIRKLDPKCPENDHSKTESSVLRMFTAFIKRSSIVDHLALGHKWFNVHCKQVMSENDRNQIL
jgi:hypothetical protein